MQNDNIKAFNLINGQYIIGKWIRDEGALGIVEDAMICDLFNQSNSVIFERYNLTSKTTIFAKNNIVSFDANINHTVKDLYIMKLEEYNNVIDYQIQNQLDRYKDFIEEVKDDYDVLGTYIYDTSDKMH